jgi:hypothetical protein
MGTALPRPTAVGIIRARAIKRCGCNAGVHHVERTVLGGRSNYEAEHLHNRRPHSKGNLACHRCGLALTILGMSAITQAGSADSGDDRRSNRCEVPTAFPLRASKSSCSSQSSRTCGIRVTVPRLQHAYSFPHERPETDLPCRPTFLLMCRSWGRCFRGICGVKGYIWWIESLLPPYGQLGRRGRPAMGRSGCGGRLCDQLTEKSS